MKHLIKIKNSSNISIGRGGAIGNFLENAANNIVDFARKNTALNQGIYSPFRYYSTSRSWSRWYSS